MSETGMIAIMVTSQLLMLSVGYMLGRLHDEG